jgi:hypothetical protein
MDWLERDFTSRQAETTQLLLRMLLSDDFVVPVRGFEPRFHG